MCAPVLRYPRLVQLGLPFDSGRALDGPPLPWSAETAAGMGSAATTSAESEMPRPVDVAADVLIFVRHRRARRYVLRVRADGRVRVTIPRGGTPRDARRFAERHRAWIERQRARTARQTWASDAVASYRARAQLDLPPRLHQLAAQHGLRVQRVSVRNQRTRWGSCGHNGHISVNWRLVLMPDWVRDYVLIHELMHLRRMDHSPEFWRHVAAACPRYRDARAWLRANGASLR